MTTGAPARVGRAGAFPIGGGAVDAIRHPMLWGRAHPFGADLALALLLMTISIAGFLTVDQSAFPQARDPDPIGCVLIIGAVLPIAWRRRVPVIALAVCCAATIPYWVLNYMDYSSGTALFILVYSVGAYRDRPVSLYAFIAAAAVLTAVMFVGVTIDGEELTFFGLMGNVAMFAAAWAFGESLRNRRAYLGELEQRTAALEREQAEAAHRAAEEERRRIARELHDVVAHSMSVMVVQAGAARRVIDADPETATESLGQIERTGREAMTEMRRLLGVLRQSDDDAPEVGRAPQPGLAALSDLAASFADAGLTVTVDLTGAPRPLPPGVDLSAYRIVQEALTNTVKHAGAQIAGVHIGYGDDTLTVEVTDDGRGAAAPDTGGHGLLGMRERAGLLGGTVTAGPAAGGGFAVRAVLPTDGASVPAVADPVPAEVHP